MAGMQNRAGVTDSSTHVKLDVRGLSMYDAFPQSAVEINHTRTQTNKQTN